MAKIYVMTKDGKIRTYQGNIGFYANMVEGCRVFEYLDGKQQTVAFFAQYQWVEMDNDRQRSDGPGAVHWMEQKELEHRILEQRQQAKVKHDIIDAFTRDELARRGETKPQDINTLRDRSPLDLLTDDDRKALSAAMDAAGITQHETPKSHPEPSNEQEKAAPDSQEEIPKLSPQQQQETFAALKAEYGKPSCETCGGDGVVPDDESTDPLDTRICPDC